MVLLAAVLLKAQEGAEDRLIATWPSAVPEDGSQVLVWQE
jgi:hypothetical protein